MTIDKKALGRRGEILAAAHLENLGFNIIETNYRTRPAEIDIIAKENETFCFIEVKARRSEKKGLPREAVTFAKQMKIIQGALLYLKKNKLREPRLRFDVVEVYEKEGRVEFNLIRHAFEAGANGR